MKAQFERFVLPLVLLLLLPSAGWSAAARAVQTGPVGPVPGPLHIIGGAFTGGCFAGGMRLPTSGPGFRTIHPDRSSFWGAPQTIARIEQLGREAKAHGLPPLLVEDISRPRGGPLAPHASHQVGLDVDIGLDMQPRPPLTTKTRESIKLVSLVRPDRRGVDPQHWTPGVVTLLHLAATLPDVDRILVNPAIKRKLCHVVQGDRSWLRLIRPWYGHAAHMHIRFRCPAGQADCKEAPPPPPGDSCGPTLQWWFDQLNKPPGPSKPHHMPPLPAACHAILDTPAG